MFNLENDSSLSVNAYEISNLRKALEDSTNLNEVLFKAYQDKNTENIALKRQVHRLEKLLESGNIEPKAINTAHKIKNMGKSSKRGMVNYG